MGVGGRWGGGERLLTFSASRMGAYSRWALIRGWAPIRINTVCGCNEHICYKQVKRTVRTILSIKCNFFIQCCYVFQLD